MISPVAVSSLHSLTHWGCSSSPLKMQHWDRDERCRVLPIYNHTQATGLISPLQDPLKSGALRELRPLQWGWNGEYYRMNNTYVEHNRRILESTVMITSDIILYYTACMWGEKCNRELGFVVLFCVCVWYKSLLTGPLEVCKCSAGNLCVNYIKQKIVFEIWQ